MTETADSSVGFAALRDRRAGAVVGALRARRPSRMEKKADPGHRIACGHDGLIAALCHPISRQTRRACLLIFMSDKLTLSDAIREAPQCQILLRAS